MNKGKRALLIVITNLILLGILVASVCVKLNNKSGAIDNLCTAFIVICIPIMFLVTFSVATVDKYDFDHPNDADEDSDEASDDESNS